MNGADALFMTLSMIGLGLLVQYAVIRFAVKHAIQSINREARKGVAQ